MGQVLHGCATTTERFALGVETKAGAALLIGAHAIISDEAGSSSFQLRTH